MILALAAALSVATFSRTGLASAVGNAAREGLSSVKTVAAMLADRSPGQRPEGALASLKHKRQPALHERALPKVRGAPPASPLIGLLGTPPSLPVTLPSATPLYALVSGPPVVIPPVVVAGGPPGGGTPGGPPSFSDIPPPGGGGGVIVPPTIITTAVTPAVPEPATWAMMLLGFGLMGWAIRRDKRAAVGYQAG